MNSRSLKRVEPQPRKTWVAVAGVLLGIVVLCTAAYAVTVVWTRTITSPGGDEDRGRDVSLAPNGDLYAVGYKWVTGDDNNIWIRKYSSLGVTKWTKTVDGPEGTFDHAHGSAVDGSGNLYVVGDISVSGQARDIWIRKYNSSGNKLWTRTVNGSASGSDTAFDVAVDKLGNPIVVGFISVVDEDYNIWIRKYNSSGNKLWTRTVDGPESAYDSAHGVAVDEKENIYVVGNVESPTEYDNIWIRKYSTAGQKIWTRTINGSGNYHDSAYGAAVDSDDNLIAVGKIRISGGENLIWVRKYSPSGAKLWTRTSSSTGNQSDVGSDVAIDANDAVYVIGSRHTLGSPPVSWIRKYSSLGKKRWTTTYVVPADQAQAYGSGITVNATKRVYATGSVLRDGSGFDLWVRKYAQ